MYGLTDGVWSIVGWGDCVPEAIFQRQGAVAGYWEIAGDEPPGPEATSFDIDAWPSEACHGRVRVQGQPRVRLTDDAVLVAIAVHPISHNDVCRPGKASKVTVTLPQPLGDRVLLDAGRLPMPLVVGAGM